MFFDDVEQHAAQFLGVLLHERLPAVPAEALGQGLRRDGRALAELEPREQPLELQRDAVVLLLLREALAALPQVQAPPELGGHEQGLQEAVHVAGGALVVEPAVVGGPRVAGGEHGSDRRRRAAHAREEGGRGVARA